MSDFRSSQERTSENSVHAKFGTVRDQRRRQEKAGPLWEGGGTENARLEYWSHCSAGTGHSIYATRHIFVCHVATSGDELLRIPQPDERPLRIPLRDPFEGSTPGFGSVWAAFRNRSDTILVHRPVGQRLFQQAASFHALE